MFGQLCLCGLWELMEQAALRLLLHTFSVLRLQATSSEGHYLHLQLSIYCSHKQKHEQLLKAGNTRFRLLVDLIHAALNSTE